MYGLLMKWFCNVNIIAELVWDELCICGSHTAGCGLFPSWSRYEVDLTIFNTISMQCVKQEKRLPITGMYTFHLQCKV